MSLEVLGLVSHSFEKNWVFPEEKHENTICSILKYLREWRTFVIKQVYGRLPSKWEFKYVSLVHSECRKSISRKKHEVDIRSNCISIVKQ